MTLLVSALCSLIFETVCIRITTILIIRFVFEETFKLMFVFGKYSFHSYTTVETSAHFSSMSAIISWCVPLIVFQLCGCRFQEFLVGVEKVAFSHPQGSIIGFLSSPLFSHTCGHVFSIFWVLTGSLTCIGPILFVPSLIDSIVFEIDVGQVWMLAISGVYLSKWWKF